MGGLLAPVLFALAPIFGAFALGSGLRRFGVIPKAVWDGLDRLVFYVLFPCLLFYKTANADLSGRDVGLMAAVLIASILVTAVLTRATKGWTRLSDQGFVSVYQASYRMNAYVGIAASTALLGTSGDGLAAIAVAIIAPMINGLSVIALVAMNDRLNNGGKTVSRLTTLRRIVIGFFRNPLILATGGGILYNLSGIPLPELAAVMLRLLASGALPLALLGVGAGLTFAGMQGKVRAVFIGCLSKLLVAPALTAGAALAVGLTGTAAYVAIIFTALPTSASSYQMTKAMGGDGDLMAVLITAQTVAAAVTMPVILLWAGTVFLDGGLLTP